jgi:hypothetical protein
VAVGSDRIAAIDAALKAVVDGRYTREDIATRSGSDDVVVRYRPKNIEAAGLIVTDTRVSWHLEVPEAKWEADSSDQLENERLWAIRVARDLAAFGAVRVRRSWCPWGRETFILRSDDQTQELGTDRAFKVVGYWPPW